MHLLNLPSKLLEDRILPYLKWNDFLGFRRVSKATQAISQIFIKEHYSKMTPEIEIGEDGTKTSFGAFLKMNIPTSRIFLNNPSGTDFYQKDSKNLAKFLKICGPLVKHLRVKILSLYPDKKECNFLEALVNLQTLEVDYFDGGKPTLARKAIPNIFRQLRSLKIGQKNGVIIPNVTSRTVEYLETCQELEHVSLPFNSHLEMEISDGFNPQLAMGTAFMIIDEAIRERASKKNGTLKTFDFCCYHDQVGLKAAHMQAFGSGTFLELLMTCVKNGVQLENVGSLWFHMWGREVTDPDLGIPVLSLVNLHPCMLPVNMPNLERILIQATNQSSPGNQWKEQRPDWPALKMVEITSNCQRISCWKDDAWKGKSEKFNQDAQEIFQFFFQEIRRPNLTEIRLKFVTDFGQVAVPKTGEIVESCPNLKKITLINWPGTNKALIKLWSGLPALEEISLECCKDLGNVAFVGEDAKNPVFFKLKMLRKLSLKGLDQMPKITDLLFSLMIRHLKLTHLILTSDRPLKSVTSAGILSLLEGCFAEKIEKFPFQHWSLENASAAEMRKMEVKFRSYNML